MRKNPKPTYKKFEPLLEKLLVPCLTDNIFLFKCSDVEVTFSEIDHVTGG